MIWLIVLIGPVGSGKTKLAFEIQQRVPCTVISNDAVRKELFPKPKYSPSEVAMVHRIAMNQIRQALLSGNHVIYDGTNLTRYDRHELRAVVGDLAHLLPVVVCAPEHLVRTHLEARHAAGADKWERWDGKNWWDVYQELRTMMEPLEEPHLLVDSSQPFSRTVNLVATLLDRKS